MNGPVKLWRSASSLAIIAILGTGLLSGVWHLTSERIAEQQRRAVLKQLEQVLGQVDYDNELPNDTMQIRDEEFFPGGQTVTVYRARLEDQTVAVVLRFIARSGYNGDIHLLAGIRPNGTLIGVRVTGHKETPGLGDKIESQRTGWLTGFEGRSLTNPSTNQWAVRRDGGVFDQFTGATISPRAVVEAVELALLYFDKSATELISASVDG